MSIPTGIGTDKALCAIETLHIIRRGTVEGIPRSLHIELERAVFTIEILSCLCVYLGLFMRLPSIVVKTKSQTPLKKLF
jgi:uncharacterized membrane protein